jgi:transcriptional regulator with XRE-family HTH domain
VPNRLNIEALRSALTASGLNPAGLAKQLDVSREGVSKWLSGEAFPRPDKLLRLSSTVGLSFRELVIVDEVGTPRVAFRRKRGSSTTDAHISHAQEMGRTLRSLVPYLPFDKLVTPPVLKEPANEYGYLQAVSISVRKTLGVSPSDPITFRHLVRRFGELQAVLIPVTWGKKDRHENATHIYLPDSRTTWIYLNLDVQAHDFLFWMAHELGHSLSPDLVGDAAEDFADGFAAALLFPQERAGAVYAEVFAKQPGRQVNLIKEWAERFAISPYCVYQEINAFARHVGRAEVKLEPAIHGATTNFNKRYLLVSEALFGGKKPKPEDLIRAATEAFETPFYEALSRHLKESDKGPSFVQTVLDVSNIDAKGIHAELT